MQTIFRKAVGDTPKIRVIEFLIEGKDFDYSLSDIAEGAEIGRTTLFRIWDDLEKTGIVKHTRDIGNAKLYRVNRENLLAQKLIRLFDDVVIRPLNKRKVVVMH